MHILINKKTISDEQAFAAKFFILLFALCLMGYPAIGLVSAAIDLPTKWASITYRIIVALLAIIFSTKVWRNRQLTKWTMLLVFWLALYLARLTTNLIDGHPNALYEMVFFLLAVALPLLAFLKGDWGCVESRAGNVIIWFAAGILILALVGEYLNWFGAHSNTSSGRLSTTNVNPITLGHVSTSLLLATVISYMQAGKKNAFALTGAVVLGLLAMGLTGSRGPFLALSVTLVILFFAPPWKGKNSVINRILIFTLLTSSILVFRHPIPIEFIAKQSSSQIGQDAQISPNVVIELKALHNDRMSLSDESVMSRQELIRRSFFAFLRSPIYGTSNFSANKGEHPHNIILESFQNLGLLGGAILVFLIGVGILRAWKRISQKKYLISCLFFQALVGSLFSGSLFAHTQFFILLAVVLAPEEDIWRGQI